MKKLAMKVVLGAALIMTPFASAFGLEMMSADSMKDVTAQAGVSIGLDDIVIYQASQKHSDKNILSVMPRRILAFEIRWFSIAPKSIGGSSQQTHPYLLLRQSPGADHGRLDPISVSRPQL